MATVLINLAWEDNLDRESETQVSVQVLLMYNYVSDVVRPVRLVSPTYTASTIFTDLIIIEQFFTGQNAPALGIYNL